MSNQATNTAAAAAPAKAKKPSIVDTFLKGCAKGFKVGIENITPAMILGYVLVYILKETGMMDILGTVMSPVMGLFGLRSSPRLPAARPPLPCMRQAR